MSDMRSIYPGERAFWLYDTHGVPLDIQMDELLKRNIAIALDGFARAAIDHGWTIPHVFAVIDGAISDSAWEDKALMRERLKTMLGAA